MLSSAFREWHSLCAEDELHVILREWPEEPFFRWTWSTKVDGNAFYASRNVTFVLFVVCAVNCTELTWCTFCGPDSVFCGSWLHFLRRDLKCPFKTRDGVNEEIFSRHQTYVHRVWGIYCYKWQRPLVPACSALCHRFTASGECKCISDKFSWDSAGTYGWILAWLGEEEGVSAA